MASLAQRSTTFRSLWRLLWLGVFVALVWLVFVLKPNPSFLFFEVSTQANSTQRITGFFKESGKPPGGVAFRDIGPSKKAQRVYLNTPIHFEANQAIVEFGKAANDWELSGAGLRSRFLLFSLDSHTWDSATLLKLIRENPRNVGIDASASVQLKAKHQAPRIQLPLTTELAAPTLEFNLLRFVLAALVGLLCFFVGRGDLPRHIAFLVRNRHRDWQALSANQTTIKSDRWQWWGLALLLVVLLYRLYPYWFAPGFYIEDTMEFSDAASGRSSLFDPAAYFYYRGYFVFVSELIVGMVRFFPATWAAHLYMFAGSAFLFLAIAVFSRTGLFSSKAMLLFAPTLILLIAFTDKVFFLSVTGTLFSTTLLLMALAFSAMPKDVLPKMCVFALMAALAWSGPYGAQLLPFALLMALFFGSGLRLLIFGFIALMAILYVLSSASGLTQFSNLLVPEVPVAFFRALVQHILFFNLFGALNYKIGVLVVLLVVLLLYFLRKDRVFQKACLVFLAIGLSSFLTYYISSKYQQYNGRLLSYHVVMSQFCWLMFLLLTFDRLLQSIRLQGPKAIVSSLVVVSFLGISQAKEKVLLKKTYFPPDPVLAEFLLAVDYAQDLSLENDQYIQLWYVKRRQFFTTSFTRGASPEQGKPVDSSLLPKFVQKFVAPVHLQREINSMVDYDTREGVLIYADLDDPSLKRKMDRPSHLR